jgi:ribosomal protein S27E
MSDIKISEVGEKGFVEVDCPGCGCMTFVNREFYDCNLCGHAIHTPKDVHDFERISMPGFGVPKFLVSTDGTYVWMELEHGQVQVKFDDEGVIADMYTDEGEGVGSCGATYEELAGE